MTRLRTFATLPPHSLLTMPSLSPTMSQGSISKWKKKEGEEIGPGQVLAEVETDKATIEWESQEEGFIAKLLVGDGASNIAIGTPVAVLVEAEGDVAAFKDYTPGSAPTAAPAAPAAAKPAPPPAAAAAPAAPKTSFPPHQVLTMPALSPTMMQGNIMDWKKAVGDEVKPGDMYCEVETDKATMGWEAQDEGFIAKLLVPGGAKDIPIGTPVMVVVEDKALVSAFANFSSADAPGDSPAPAAAEAPAPAAAPAAPTSAPAPTKASAHASVAAPAAGASGRVKASPYAKKLAAEAGVELSGVAGTGPDGRVVADDVKKAAAAPKAVAAPAAAVAAAGAEYLDIPHTQIRRVTAQRLLQSKTTVPHYYLSMECGMDQLTALRTQINEQTAKSGVKISVNDFIIKASALALKKVPAMNSQWNPDFIREFKNVDISVAVTTPQGLMVPIVKDADKKGLSSISSEVKALAAKAKEGKLAPAEFMGGTFTISNLGMYGIKSFAAIVNPPQAAILAVGATDKKVVMDKATGKLSEVSTLVATLSCDHRVVDGAVGAEWLLAFKGYIENPYTMLL